MKMATDTGRAYWERHARSYDLSMLLLGRPTPRMRERTVDAVRGAQRVLELAAGTGILTTAIAPVVGELVATDYADAMVSTLARRVADERLVNVRVERADLYALTFEPHSFDAVVAANVLHLVPDVVGALGAMRRMLRPGGVLVVPTYCHDETVLSRWFSRIVALTGFPGRRRFSASSLRAAVESAGLRIRASEVIGGLIPITYLDTVG